MSSTTVPIFETTISSSASVVIHSSVLGMIVVLYIKWGIGTTQCQLGKAGVPSPQGG